MKIKFKAVIMGTGRIGQAVAYYLNHGPLAVEARFFRGGRQVRDCALIIGALPGELGQDCLNLALRYRKHLIDLSDIDPPFYLARKKEIAARGIIVIPGCGFSPGLVNCILGRELARNTAASEVEIKAGSLANRPHLYPFLWCFEDLVLEHQIPSRQILDNKKKKFGPFAGYRLERFFGRDAESYYCASGFENILKSALVRRLTYRVVRPRGFKDFFLYFQNYGFLRPEQIAASKARVESCRVDNLTFAQIVCVSAGRRITWLLKSSSGSREALNSMQKITASVPAVISRMIMAGDNFKPGLNFMEEYGRDEGIFQRLLKGVKRLGLVCTRVDSAERA